MCIITCQLYSAPTSPILDNAAALHVSGWVIGVTIGAMVIVVTAVLTLATVVIIVFVITRKKKAITGQLEINNTYTQF